MKQTHIDANALINISKKITKYFYMEKIKSIKIRVFISLLLAFCFIFLALSGILLYIAPQCRVAEQISWKILFLEKEQWVSLHLTSALVFLLLAFVHLLIYNWKIFVGYLKPSKKYFFYLRPEFLCSLIVAIILFVGAVLILPPISFLSETQDAIQMYYQEKSGFDSKQKDKNKKGKESD